MPSGEGGGDGVGLERGGPQLIGVEGHDHRVRPTDRISVDVVECALKGDQRASANAFKGVVSTDPKRSAAKREARCLVIM